MNHISSARYLIDLESERVGFKITHELCDPGLTI